QCPVPIRAHILFYTCILRINIAYEIIRISRQAIDQSQNQSTQAKPKRRQEVQLTSDITDWHILSYNAYKCALDHLPFMTYMLMELDLSDDTILAKHKSNHYL